MVKIVGNSNTANFCNDHLSTNIKLNAGDVVNVKVMVSAGSSETIMGGSGNPYTYFSGYKVY